MVRQGPLSPERLPQCGHRLWKAEDDLVAVVPTMGALHDGHRIGQGGSARLPPRHCECYRPNTVCGGGRPDAYPRGEAADRKGCRRSAPTWRSCQVATRCTRTVCHQCEIEAEVLCGLRRPAFWWCCDSGEQTIQSVPGGSRLFIEKDYQQFLVVRRMARDLDIPIEIVPVPTVREPDGLAMSSRNVYLSKAQRAVAPVLYRVLSGMAKRMTEGETASAAINWGRAALESAGFDRIEYLEVRNAETLAPIDGAARNARVFVAAHIGETRLIDNVAV